MHDVRLARPSSACFDQEGLDRQSLSPRRSTARTLASSFGLFTADSGHCLATSLAC